ncbi:hypothetical protein [Pseudoroseomonas cervicalis]|uniref:hypothetical protein n=1 Tax=Teichococcus cervicalis TaxID=204525 RepID=UPI0022F1B6D2|nr:hypothetical protein [Pseudoroseomonas cervicalis]WBV42630.1 hypothetical protein PFY06_15510 [Pseudoroseomonas cervicalis]
MTPTERLTERPARSPAEVAGRPPASGRLPRRAALLLAPLLLAACGGGSEAPPVLAAPPGYAYLTPLRLNVLEVEVVEPGAMRADPPAPLSPAAQAARMGRERLSAVGTTGRARFLVDNAVLTRETADGGGLFSQRTERLTVVIRVRVEVLGNDGRRVGFAEAEVRRSATQIDDGPAGRARNADQIVRQAMDDLNVEFEFQLRRNLRDWIMSGPPAAPLPGPVQQENLSRPGS